MQHRFGSAFEQIRDADVELSLAQPDGVVDGNERIETHMQWRSQRARAKLAISLVKYFGELSGHVEGRLADRREQSSYKVRPDRESGFSFLLTSSRGRGECQRNRPCLGSAVPLFMRGTFQRRVSILNYRKGRRLSTGVQVKGEDRYLLFFFFFIYSSTSATVLRWSSVLESTVSRAS